jgi:uncharacterized damage-inducible protein DinB
MKRFFLFALLFCSPGCPALAQTGQPPSPKNALATWLRNAYTGRRNDLIKSAENVPDDIYGLRPGAQKEVRTYGQIIGHLANFNYLWCSQAKQENNPAEGKDFERLETKAALTKALTDALGYCDRVYAALTDALGLEVIQITQENGKQTRVPRMSLLILNHAHNNEHYGNLVTYMRIKSIVPPSSQPRPTQIGQTSSLLEMVKTGGIVEPDLLPQIRGKLIKQ